MRVKLFILLAVAALAGPLAAHAATPRVVAPTLPTSAQDHSVDPVVLTGNQFPSWSAGPSWSRTSPGSPANSSTAGQEGNVPVGHQATATRPGHNPYDPRATTATTAASRGRGCPSRTTPPVTPPTACSTPTSAPNVSRIVGLPLGRASGKFVQFPLQVDEKFTRFLSNNASDFAFYSGVDQETNYAFDREGFRYTADQ